MAKTGAESLAEGILYGGQGVAGGLKERYKAMQDARDMAEKQATLADLINQAQPQVTGWSPDPSGGPMAESPILGDTTYPDINQLSDSLVQKAGKYGLLDFYLNLRKSKQPEYKVTDGSIIKFPPDGGVPTVAGTLPAQAKAATPKDEAFRATYAYLLQGGMSPDKALETSMKLIEAGKIETTGMNNASRERIAKMQDDTKRFLGSLNAKTRQYVADKAAGKKGTPFKESVMTYPGAIGSLYQRWYNFDPEKPETMDAAEKSIDMRFKFLNDAATVSGEKRKSTWYNPTTWLSQDDAKTMWEQFTAQFEPGYTPPEGSAPIDVTELPGDLELMGTEYMNLMAIKNGINEIRGGQIPIEEPGADIPAGLPPVEEMRNFLLKKAREEGKDTSAVLEATPTDISTAYEDYFQ